MSPVSAEHVFDALSLAELGSAGELAVRTAVVVYEPSASRPPFTENFGVAEAPLASETTSQFTVRVPATWAHPEPLANDNPAGYVATTRIPVAADGPVFVTVSV